MVSRELPYLAEHLLLSQVSDSPWDSAAVHTGPPIRGGRKRSSAAQDIVEAHAVVGRASSCAEADMSGSIEQWMDLLELLGQTLRCLTRGRWFECHHRKMGTDLMFAPYRSAVRWQDNDFVDPRMNGCSLENYPNALIEGSWSLVLQSLKTESLKACSLGLAGIAQLMLHPCATTDRLERRSWIAVWRLMVVW